MSGTDERMPAVLIRATNPYGYRFGHSHPWGIVTGLRWMKGRACYVIEFSEGVVDFWPINDPSDPYEFKPIDLS